MPRAYISKCVVRHAARAVTRSKYDVLAALATHWQRARNAYVAECWDPQRFVEVMGSHRRAREMQRRRGWAPVPLSVAHHQTALLSALAAVKAAWTSRLVLIGRQIACSDAFTADERRWSRWLLRHPVALQECLNGETPRDGPFVARPQRAATRLRKLLLRRRGHAPRPERRRWFEIDKARYRTFLRTDDRYFRGRWIAFGIGRGRRLCVPLAGTDPLLDPDAGSCGSNIRVFIEDRISLHFRVRVPIRTAAGSRELGIDKGYRTLLTVSDGDPLLARSYGANVAEMIARIAEEGAGRTRERRRIAAYERSIRNTRPKAARQIRRRNLGHRSGAIRRMRQRAQLRGEIGRALNAMFAAERSVSRLHVERLDLRSTRLSRAMHRRLGRWASGYLQERLSYKAELNGVELNVVNAAYTSQTCPSCGFASKENRRKDAFECRSCGYTGPADAVAATNVLARGRDPAITRFMAVPVVKQILDERWRSARNGRAWGLSAGNAETGSTPLEAATGESREQPGVMPGPSRVCKPRSDEPRPGRSS